MWFFTSANPALTFGGMEGETKKEMYDQLPQGTFPKTEFISPSMTFEEVEAIVNREFRYPFAVKPNVGMMGYMFRRINDREALKHYHEAMYADYLVQELVNMPLEVSVFYYRMPGEEKGRVSGFLKKESPYVKGDGKSTIRDLMHAHEGIRFKLEEMMTKHEKALDRVLNEGEIYFLSNASNRTQGGKLTGLEKEIDDRLLEIFDRISHYSGKFLYGRYDIKCNSIEELKEGRNFYILEYNGSGSGTQHVYGNNYSLPQAWNIILHHWKMLYRISKKNSNLGIRPWNFKSGLKVLIDSKKNLKRLKALDSKFPSY